MGKVYALHGAAFVGGAAAVGGDAGARVSRCSTGRGAALVVVLVSLVTLNWVFVIRRPSELRTLQTGPPADRRDSKRFAEGDVVAHYNVALPSMVYYLGRHIEILFDREKFLTLLKGDKRVFAVLSAGDYEEIARDAGVPTCVLDRRPTVNIKLKAVLAERSATGGLAHHESVYTVEQCSMKEFYRS